MLPGGYASVGRRWPRSTSFFAKIYEILWVLHSIATYCYPRPLPDYRFCDAVSHVFNFSFVTTFLKLQKSLQHIVSMVEAAMLLRLKNSRWTWWTGVWALKKKSFVSGMSRSIWAFLSQHCTACRMTCIPPLGTTKFSIVIFAPQSSSVWLSLLTLMSARASISCNFQTRVNNLCKG